MSENEKLTQIEWHRKLAAQLFNQTWDLLDKEDRTEDENSLMIHSAHGSVLHWQFVIKSGKYPESGPINVERGEWQVSRVYSIVKRPEAALYHAKRCLDICKENNIEDFDIAFAYEAMARAYSVSGDIDNLKKYLDFATEAGNSIKDEKDKEYFMGELKSIN